MRYISIIVLFIFVSCAHNAEKKVRSEASMVAIEKDKEAKFVDSSIPNNDTIPENGISIVFNEFCLLIDNVEAWNEDGSLDRIHNDTAKISFEIGEIIGGNSMRIINCNYDHIDIYQRFENSITIMNEGPHCDMLKWKHYTSGWEKVEKLDKFNYKASSITEEQMEQFIPVDLDEFKKAVKVHCGENWMNLIQDIQTINEYPCGIGTSKIELKIRLSNSETSNALEKIIEFDIAMGC